MSATETVTAPAAAPEELKRLSFVSGAVASALSLTGATYTTAKGYVPAFAKGVTDYAEKTVTSLSAPYVPTVTGVGTGLLKFADTKVDAVVSGCTARVDALTASATSFVSHQVETFNAARTLYLAKISDALEVLKEKGLTGAAADAADAVVEALKAAREAAPEFVSSKSLATYHALVTRVSETYQKLVDIPVVYSALETAQPYVVFAKDKYTTAHDSLVASPQYNKAWTTGTAVVTTVTDLPICKATVATVYPYVAPYTDPALEYVKASPIFDAAVAHIKPTPTVMAS